MRYDKIIAIDPDVDKSGVAILDVAEKTMSYASMSFPILVDFLRKNKEAGINMRVLIEAGWRKKANWHVTYGSNAQNAMIGNKTGRNHETGRKLIEMAKFYKVNIEEIQPLTKVWKGRDGKITQPELLQQLKRRGIELMGKRTNQDVRDAILIALMYS